MFLLIRARDALTTPVSLKPILVSSAVRTFRTRFLTLRRPQWNDRKRPLRAAYKLHGRRYCSVRRPHGDFWLLVRGDTQLLNVHLSASVTPSKMVFRACAQSFSDVSAQGIAEQRHRHELASHGSLSAETSRHSG